MFVSGYALGCKEVIIVAGILCIEVLRRRSTSHKGAAARQVATFALRNCRKRLSINSGVTLTPSI
eukprot:787297-Amphidinium_carterae.1